jgi:hypothetical protein
MKPIVVLSNPKQQCATFFWTDRPEFYIGYRFMEHLPESQGSPLVNIDDLPRSAWGNMPETSKALLSSREGDPWIKNWLIFYTENECNDEKQLSFKSFKNGSAWAKCFDNQRAQQREFYFKPVSDGVLVWMKLATSEPIPGAFCVQQCLRFTGSTNKEWRRQISNVPFLSEFDTQAQGKPNQTLTFVRKSRNWLQFPLANHRYYTQTGLVILAEKSAGEIAHGLIVRESLDKNSQQECTGNGLLL